MSFVINSPDQQNIPFSRPWWFRTRTVPRRPFPPKVAHRRIKISIWFRIHTEPHRWGILQNRSLPPECQRNLRPKFYFHKLYNSVSRFIKWILRNFEIVFLSHSKTSDNEFLLITPLPLVSICEFPVLNGAPAASPRFPYYALLLDVVRGAPAPPGADVVVRCSLCLKFRREVPLYVMDPPWVICVPFISNILRFPPRHPEQG